MGQTVCGTYWDNWLTALQNIIIESGNVRNATTDSEKVAASNRLSMWKGTADMLYQSLLGLGCINPNPAPPMPSPATGA